MSKQTEVAIVGGGQSGLSMSYHLTRQGRDHIVFEKQRIGEAWRSGRWDSFTLVSPNWAMRLPGFEYAGDDPDGFMPRDQIVDYLERYAASFGAPVHTGVKVQSIDSDSNGYMLRTSEGDYAARSVVIAPGLFQQPKLPAFSAQLSTDITQLHTGQYRNSDALAPGGVLVVGSGQSGCQIAEELYQAGRKVYLSVGSAGRVVRRYRGKDCFWLLERIGFFSGTIDKAPIPRARYVGNPHLSGKDGGHTLNLRRFAADGVTLMGHIQNADGNRVTVAPDLNANMAKADQFSANIIKGMDEAVAQQGLDLPEDPEVRDAELSVGELLPEIETLDLRTEGVTNVIWAGGYKFDFSWVKFPIFDDDGFPVQVRGVTAQPGLYFLGLHFLHTRKSGLFLGVGEDAEHIADHMSAYLDR
jgi:putative flavoprotein involved in K+ transport